MRSFSFFSTHARSNFIEWKNCISPEFFRRVVKSSVMSEWGASKRVSEQAFIALFQVISARFNVVVCLRSFFFLIRFQNVFVTFDYNWIFYSHRHVKSSLLFTLRCHHIIYTISAHTSCQTNTPKNWKHLRESKREPREKKTTRKPNRMNSAERCW